MSFRGRLLVFFTIIVVIPMIAVALVLFSLTEDSEHGKVDARLAGGMRTTLAFYEEGREEARTVVARIAADDVLVEALRDADTEAADIRLTDLVAADPDIEAIAYETPAGNLTATPGSADAVAAASVEPTTSSGERLGTLAASTTPAAELARESARYTGLDVRVFRGERVLATTIEGARDVGAESGDVEIGGDEYRARAQEIRETVGPSTGIQILQDASEMSDAITRSRLLIGGLLVAFLVLSLASSVFVVRALQGQVDGFLQAARRLGGGDLAERVPVEGDDEFAALGQEFNTMAEQLEAHIVEVERKRRELEESIRRIGEAFGTGLDRQGLVDLAVRTAIEACDADGGRLVPVDPRELDEVRLADDPALLRALEEAERQVFSPGEGVEPAHRVTDGVHALAMPLVGRHDEEGESETIGAISIAKRGGDFTSEQRDLLAYLTTQTSVSLENADLHRRIQRQAITDELTGLSNVRHFHELLDQEIERAQRFNNHIGLVDGRHRQLQERQRHLRASAGRPRPEGGGARVEGAVARHRLPGSLRRRGDVGDPSPDRHRRRGDARRAHARGDRGAAREAPGRRRCPQDDGELRRGRAAGLGDRQALPDRRGRRSPLPGEAQREEPRGAR